MPPSNTQFRRLTALISTVDLDAPDINFTLQNMQAVAEFSDELRAHERFEIVLRINLLKVALRACATAA